MEEKKFLIKLNLLTYLNNFLYIIVSDKVEIINILSLWVLSPFVFLILTSFILENKYHTERLYLKKYALMDFVIRFLGACSAFTELNLEFKTKVLSCSFFMIINIIIEIKMLKLEPKKEYTMKKDVLSGKICFDNAGKSISLGVYSFIITAFFFGVTWVKSKENLYLSIVFVIVYSVAFSIIEYIKISRCYRNIKEGRKVIIMNISIFIIGVLIWIIQKLCMKDILYDNIANFMLILSLIPSIQTTRSIAITYRKTQDNL